MKGKLFSPHTGRKHHNKLSVYYRKVIEELSEELQAADGTAFNLMKLPHATLTAGQES